MLIEDLRFHWETIRDEALQLDPRKIHSANRQAQTHAQVAAALVKLGPGWMPSWGPTMNQWLTWGLCYEDQYLLGDAGMPKTVALLRTLKGIKTAAIAWMRPKTKLGLHRHPELAGDCYTLHLGLEVPERCFLGRLQGLTKEENGKLIIFDGSKSHFAYNMSDKERLILYMEFHYKIQPGPITLTEADRNEARIPH